MSNRRYYLLWLVLLCASISMNAYAQYDRGESSGDFALPVTLLDFSATGEDHAIVLQWTTASEIDVVGFNLYRSTEPIGGFERINLTTIPAQGGGPEINNYDYVDGDVVYGCVYYYKLASLELDGSEVSLGTTIKGSPTESLKNNSFQFDGSYPEPFNGQVSIVFSLPAESRISLKVYDSRGCEIAVLLNRILPPGEHVEVFHGDHLPSGVYICQLQSEDGSRQIHKMVLLR